MHAYIHTYVHTYIRTAYIYICTLAITIQMHNAIYIYINMKKTINVYLILNRLKTMKLQTCTYACLYEDIYIANFKNIFIF